MGNDRVRSLDDDSDNLVWPSHALQAPQINNFI